MFKFRFIFLLFAIFLCQNTFSQSDVNVNNQTFSVKNFKSNYKSLKVSGIKFSFDLILNNPLENYFHNPYYIYFRLVNDSNIVYTSVKNIKVYADKTYGKKVSEHFLSFTIPYSEIKISEGKHSLTLEVFAKNDSKDFPVFFKKQLVINKPKLYNYNEQEFNISNFRAVANIKSRKVEGVKIYFNSAFKFKSSEINGIDIDETLGKYIFYIKFTDITNKSEVALFDNKVGKLEITPLQLANKYEIFIPLNNINLPKGKYKIAVDLYAKTYDQKYLFKNLANDTVLLNQPNLYFLNFKLNKCDVVHKKYDVSSVIGQIFSKSTSNTGLGYPDVYWSLKTGSITKFYSETNKNRLWAIPGKASIIIAENDPLFFSVVDYDITSFDDLIGKIKLQNKTGNFSKKYTSINFGDVKLADFEYTKVRFPKLEKSFIISKKSKIKGVSGLNCELTYSFSNLTPSSNIYVTPFIKFKDKLYEVDYINIDKNTKHLNEQKAESTINVFIPYVKIPNKSSVGFIIKDNNSIFIQNKIIENKEIIKPEINDISVKIENINEYFNRTTNTFGILILLKWELPLFYKTNVKKIRSEIKLYANNKIFIDTIVDNIKELGNNRLRLFIPYYKLKKYNQKVDFKIIEQNFVRKYQTGNSELKFNTKVDNISEIEFKKINLKFKNITDLNSLLIKIYHDNKLVCESEKISSAKKINFTDFNKKIVCSKNDKIKISVINIDKFGIEKNILTKEIFADEFVNRKKIIIKNHKSNCKKIKIIPL